VPLTGVVLAFRTIVACQGAVLFGDAARTVCVAAFIACVTAIATVISLRRVLCQGRVPENFTGVAPSTGPILALSLT
jgi:hypothetical protein